MMCSTGEFSVVQWFTGGAYEYVRRNVDAEEAFAAARHYCTCVGAKVGTTVRVIIEDGGGAACFDWNRDDGIVYYGADDPNIIGKWKMGADDMVK